MQILVNLKFSHTNSSSTDKFKVEANITSNSNSNSNFHSNSNSNLKAVEIELYSIEAIKMTYNWWKDNYYNLVSPRAERRLALKGFNTENNTNISASEMESNIAFYQEECKKSVYMLRNLLNKWLSPVKSELEKVWELEANSDIYFVVDTQDIESEIIAEILHKIPWREWNYFPDCYALEAALCLNEADSNLSEIESNEEEVFRRVRIISIFGDVENIQEGIDRDREEIEKLEQRGAEIISLVQPKRHQLKKLWDEPCDILFYSGHSNSEENSTAGRFKINDSDDLNLEEIRNTFQAAIKKGLQIAIFNSCDGLGLACELAKINLPYVIVWRESVPDAIAQKFIEFFLSSYSQGESLFNAVKYARIQLKELILDEDENNQIPGLNWLPIICKNTVNQPPSWQDLGGLTGKLPDSPYKGLSAFTEEDTKYYFGREKFVAELLAAARSKSLVAIVGASGSGKSSVVFAGLVPQLRNIGNVDIVSFRPGNNPFDALA
ncbi:MAG: CHAT domain-containing protein, partial [Cyanobacteria bacterium P01_D01_bin.116]